VTSIANLITLAERRSKAAQLFMEMSSSAALNCPTANALKIATEQPDLREEIMKAASVAPSGEGLHEIIKSSRMESEVAINALMTAVWRRQSKQGVILRSDQGSQFSSYVTTGNISCRGAQPDSQPELAWSLPMTMLLPQSHCNFSFFIVT
jgi:hypothetical protein